MFDISWEITDTPAKTMTKTMIKNDNSVSLLLIVIVPIIISY